MSGHQRVRPPQYCSTSTASLHRPLYGTHPPRKPPTGLRTLGTAWGTARSGGGVGGGGRKEGSRDGVTRDGGETLPLSGTELEDAVANVDCFRGRRGATAKFTRVVEKGLATIGRACRRRMARMGEGA